MKKLMLIVVVLMMISSVFLAGCNENTPPSDNNKMNDDGQYDWSKMDGGPYGDSVSYATSTDLLNWIDSGEILASHASVPGAIYKDGVIYLYFVDFSQDGIAERTGLLKSEDNGTTWSDITYVVWSGVGDKVPVDPCPFVLDDGSIRIYYFDIEEGRSDISAGKLNKIYSATSSDGINFAQDSGVRFSNIDVYDPDVIKVDDTWHMYVGNLEENKVVSATSSNGLDFTEEGTAYSGGVVPDVFYKDDLFYLYTVGIDISTSTDGSTFTKTSYRFESSINPLTADPSVIELDDGTYMMFYKTRE